jgi:transcription elongation factor GreA
MADEILLSQAGFDKLSRELDELKGPERMRIAEAIREAKSHGDLRENAAYHEAKLNQSRLEGRIADLEKVLQYAKIVDRPANSESEAHLGSKVKLLDLEWNDELTIEMVGSFEADPANDLISITSPLGAALVGRQVGEEVEVDAPAGKQKYRILAIS